MAPGGGISGGVEMISSPELGRTLSRSKIAAALRRGGRR